MVLGIGQQIRRIFLADVRGTPCDVPLPRKMNENDMAKFYFAEGARCLHIDGANVTMLTTLRIKNLALVPDLTLELQPGCNVITGETGAGKSIIIGALNLVLGERANRSLIRNGSDRFSMPCFFFKRIFNRFRMQNGFDGTTIAAVADERTVGTFTEDEIERADDDGFARAGLAGDDIAAGLKLKRQVRYEREVFDA